MKIREHDDSRSFKAPSDVEKYLVRIIQRYFDIENNYSNESVEAIVVESLTRLKRDFMSKKGFVFNLNQKTGHLTLDISDFGGEYIFEKNTAFNKDFGTDPDTIVEGNDSRLSDARDPLPHVHVIGDVKDLTEILEQAGFPAAAHSHRNQNILNMIRYIGTRTTIDLIVIEELVQKVYAYIEKLQTLHRTVTVVYEQEIQSLINNLEAVKKYLKEAQDLINNYHDWLDKANQYTDKRIQDFIDYLVSLLAQCLTPEELKEFYGKFNHFTYIADSGEIPLDDGHPNLDAGVYEDITAGDGDGDSLSQIFEEGTVAGCSVSEKDTYWEWVPELLSFRSKVNYAGYLTLLSTKAYQSYTHRVVLNSTSSDDDVISVVLAYDEDTKSQLSLIVHTGGVPNTSDSNSNKPCAAIVTSFGSSHTFTPVGNLYSYMPIDRKMWSALSYGIGVLIKRVKDTFQIWLTYDTPHDWEVVNDGETIDIYPTEAPVFSFNLANYPAMSVYRDKACLYGYGCYSQQNSIFSEVFYHAPPDTTGFGDIPGFTAVIQKTEIEQDIPSDAVTESINNRVKLFFRYDEEIVNQDTGTVQETKTITIPLPALFIFGGNNNGTLVSIKGSYASDGSFGAYADVIYSVPDYLTINNVYNNQEFLVVSDQLESLDNLSKYTIDSGYAYHLLTLDTQDKYDFVKQLLDQEHRTGEYYYSHWETGSIEEWEDDSQNLQSPFVVVYIKRSASGWRMFSEPDYMGTTRGYIMQYPMKHLSDYFKNPRIYYQIHGEKE